MDRTAHSAGWIALIHGIEHGHWTVPAQAAALVGVRAATLRRWAEQGVISRIHVERGQHYRYLSEELVVVAGLARGGTPTLLALKRYITDQLRELAQPPAG